MFGVGDYKDIKGLIGSQGYKACIPINRTVPGLTRGHMI